MAWWLFARIVGKRNNGANLLLGHRLHLPSGNCSDREWYFVKYRLTAIYFAIICFSVGAIEKANQVFQPDDRF